MLATPASSVSVAPSLKRVSTTLRVAGAFIVGTLVVALPIGCDDAVAPHKPPVKRPHDILKPRASIDLDTPPGAHPIVTQAPCTDDDRIGTPNTAPHAPTILSPSAGQVDVVAANLVIA